MKLTRRHSGIAGAIALWLQLSTLGSCGAEPASTLERVRQEKLLRAGYAEEPPYAFYDGSGRVRGESVEALRVVARELAIDEIRWVRLEFADLIPALQEGRVDAIAAGLFRTPEREAQVLFTVPTVCTGTALVVRAGSGVASIADLTRQSDLRLAVLAGSIEEAAARELGIDRERIVAVPDLVTGVAAVEQRTADAFAITLPTARTAVEAAGGTSLEIRGGRPPPEVRSRLEGCSALAFRLQDEDLVRAANGVLGDYIGSEVHLDSLSVLGFASTDLPADLSKP